MLGTEGGALDKSTHQKALETIAEGFEEREEGSIVGHLNTDRQKSQGSIIGNGSAATAENREATSPDLIKDKDASPKMDLSLTPPNLNFDLDDMDPEAQAISKMSIRERVSQVFTEIHRSAMELAETYLLETKKQVYITPVMFMSVFRIFESLLSRKNEEIERERSKYEQGVRKLAEAKTMIETMEETLTKLQPELVAKTKQVDGTAKRLVEESKDVQAIKDGVDAETEEAQGEKAAADKIKTECHQAL